MKKWENPKLQSLKIKKTECEWKFCFQCATCGYTEFRRSPSSDYPVDTFECYSCKTGKMKIIGSEYMCYNNNLCS